MNVCHASLLLLVRAILMRSSARRFENIILLRVSGLVHQAPCRINVTCAYLLVNFRETGNTTLCFVQTSWGIKCETLSHFRNIPKRTNGITNDGGRKGEYIISRSTYTFILYLWWLSLCETIEPLTGTELIFLSACQWCQAGEFLLSVRERAEWSAYQV